MISAPKRHVFWQLWALALLLTVPAGIAFFQLRCAQICYFEIYPPQTPIRSAISVYRESFWGGMQFTGALTAMIVLIFLWRLQSPRGMRAFLIWVLSALLWGTVVALLTPAFTGQMLFATDFIIWPLDSGGVLVVLGLAWLVSMGLSLALAYIWSWNGDLRSLWRDATTWHWLKVWLAVVGLSWLMPQLVRNLPQAEAVVLILYTLGWMVTWLRALHWLQRQHMRISSIPQ